jgi:hypothetical protein
VITFVLGEVIQVFQKTPTIDDRWVQVGVGTFVTLGSIAWLGYELTVASSTGGPTWFPGLTALVGVWFLLDARKDFLDGSDDRPYDDMGANEVMVVMGTSISSSMGCKTNRRPSRNSPTPVTSPSRGSARRSISASTRASSTERTPIRRARPNGTPSTSRISVASRSSVRTGDASSDDWRDPSAEKGYDRLERK